MDKRTFFKVLIFVLVLALSFSHKNEVAAQTPKMKVLILTERGGQHEGFSAAAIAWLDTFAIAHHFEMKEVHNTNDFNDAFLSNYRLFIQLDFPPYTWSDTAKAAFTKSIDEGRLGWVGFHHATLLGDFDGYSMWNWFSDFMGGIKFDNYIAATASGKVCVEDSSHPVMKGVSASFVLQKDEWYTFDKSPRPNVHVLATVDESSYQPASDIKMGDHPVVWVNEKKAARNVYFLMGHHALLFDSGDFKKMFSNAILWASGD